MSMATDNLLILSSDEKIKDDILNISSDEFLGKNTDEEFSDDFESNNLSSSTSSSEAITKNKKDSIKSDIDSDCAIKDNINLESLDCNKNEIFENDIGEINLCDFPSEKHIIVNGNHNVNIDGDIIKIITEESDINSPTAVKKSELNDNPELHTDEKCYDSNTDFVGLEIALTESNIKEPFLEELCTKMGSVVKPPVELDIKLQNLSKDDSTDIDVSYTSGSLSPESDQDVGSSFVEPSYQQLHQEIENKFKNEIERLKWRLSELEKEALHEACQNQISTMEKAVDQIKMELDLSRQEHALDTRTFSNERQELESKIENLKKEYQVANKDREAAVMRYACGEMELMNQKKERESAEKKLKDFVKEKEVLINKLKTLTTDKSRVCQMLDNKCSDLTVAQKEIDNLKEELNSRDIKIKWMQNKLRSETDARKDLEAKVELLNGKVQESLQEAEKAKHDAQESIKQFQESEENKAYTLGQQLKEEQVKYMLLQHEHDENESVRKQLQSELDTCRIRLQASTEENNSMTLKVQILEKERLEYEQNLSQLKQKTDAQSKTIADLHGSVKDVEALRIQLQCEQDRVANSQSEMERLRLSNSELLQDMESCRKREADMLEFTQKLTAKNVRLQSEFTAVEAKVQQLECEEAPLHKKIAELESKVANLLKDLEKEKSQRIEESKVLARHLAEKTARVKTLESQVEELTNEIQLVKRKDAATIKELNRELTQLRRRGEHNESGSGSDSLCHGSRASSCTSLNEHSTSSVPPPPSVTTSHPSLQLEPNRQALIERIVKLQRENAKAVEKIDFLEEHARTLVEELQKKSKVLQSYILREEAGALSSSSMDLNKAELTKHGGIMASVYGSKAVDDNMTLELSLEINRKLQAVLEDTLLKNITLKENIDTLGDEIARLTQRRHHS